MKFIRRKGELCSGLSAIAFLVASQNSAAAAPVFAASLPYTSIIGTLIAGMSVFAAGCAVMLMKTRRRAVRAEQAAHRDVHVLARRLALSEMLGRFDEQLVLFWEKPQGAPVELTRGMPSRLKSAPVETERLLDFPEWLEPASASELAYKYGCFLSRAEDFTQSVQTSAGIALEIEARATASGPMLRIRPLTDTRARSVQLADQLTKTVRELDTFRNLLNELPAPLWLRSATGHLSWVNKAYAKAVDAASPAQVVAQGYELLDQSTRAAAVDALSTQNSWQSQILTIANGKRRSLQIMVKSSGVIEAGSAIDAADSEFTTREVERVTAAHQRTLDHLGTAVATFGADRKLVYYNHAFQKLWQLDASFLDDMPDEGALLDRLREQRKLPEQADYKNWKAQHLENYAAIEPREVWWHLPDGRTLRVFTHPNPQGGITLVQENVTEVLDLKSRAAAYERMQRETLDALSDAVAVFGSDGRLRLYNPALMEMWNFDAAFIGANPHIDAMIEKGMPLYQNPVVWAELKQTVIAFGEERKAISRQLELLSGTVADVACVPLPDGATLMTFVDVTAAVRVERVLKERNEALEAATRLKNDFIQHMSYELRSPLTNIIGFTQLLTDPKVGPLNARQFEYMDYITTSSGALLALINDILDLATIDAGVMELDLTHVEIKDVVDHTIEALRDRCAEKSVQLNISIGKDAGAFTADARRVRQALYNVLSNAIGFSEAGGTVEFDATRNKAGEIIFTVQDYGIGIAEEDLPHVFERFESRTKGSSHRGVGLGLSIVKSIIELHQGKIDIRSMPGRGTLVTLVFPASMVKSGAQSAA